MRRNRFFAGERSRDQRDTDTRFSGGRGRAAWRSVIAGVGADQPRDGRAVGGARWCNGSRAGFRRDCGAVETTEPRNGGAGCGRIAQEAFCGSLVSVALVQPSGRATRTDRGEMTRLREERRTARGFATKERGGAPDGSGSGGASLD